MLGVFNNIIAVLNALQVAAPRDRYAEEALVASVLLVMLAISLVIGIIVYVINALFLMRLFAKANVPAWKAWVPFVNNWKLFELGGYQGALSLLLYSSVIPYVGWAGSIVGVVFACMAAYQIGLKNGKDGVWVVLYIFLSIVWVGILGLGKSVWNDSLGKPALGPERPPSYPRSYGGGYGGGPGNTYGGGQPEGYTPPPPPPSSPDY